jgi:arylsulfatase A-like enzyme
LGDHGWQLGEHGQWCKHTNFEVATRAPLIVAAPGQQSAGQAASGLVEFIDLYPTLAQLCELPPPPGLDGTSFVPLIENPKAVGKQAVFSQFERKVDGAGMVMGRSVRTVRYRFTQWSSPDKSFLKRELYDHHVDPDENTNLADHPSHVDTVRLLSDLLPD